MMQGALLGVLATVLAFGAGTWYGVGIGEDREFAKRAREDSIVRQVSEAAQSAAAGEIAKIKPRNVTIKQEVQREIETHTIYRDCRHSPDGLRNVNEAITGRPQPASAGELPRIGAAD